MKKISLKEVAAFSTKRGSSRELDIATYVTTDNLLQNKIGVTIANGVPPQGESFPKYEVDNILISNIRPYLKKIWFADREGISSSDVLVVSARKGYFPKFVYYSLFDDHFFDHMMKGAKGTKMPRGDKNQILEYHIPDCTLPNQIKIADVLSSIDKKISLNNKINDNLEQMAKTIFDYWFVQFDFPDKNGKPYKSSGGKMAYNNDLRQNIPEGWSAKNLKYFIATDKSGDWGKEQIEGNYTTRVDCIRGADINGINGKGETKTPIRFILEKNGYKILAPNDLVIEISGGSPTQSTGRLACITEGVLQRFKNPLICSNFCKAVSLIFQEVVFYFIHSWNRTYDNGVFFGFEGKTSGIKNLLFDSLVSHCQIPLPDKILLVQFQETVSSFEKQKQTNLKQNQELASLRDWLLPMLMNGQITVK
jgi:type I restriction enzyme S subunit